VGVGEGVSEGVGEGVGAGEGEGVGVEVAVGVVEVGGGVVCAVVAGSGALPQDPKSKEAMISEINKINDLYIVLSYLIFRT
jgi:hypothetical protein